MQKQTIKTIYITLLTIYSSNTFAGSCGSVYDDELGWLQEVEVASGQAEPLSEVPAPVTVINSDMMTNIGARTLKDVLITYVPGMTSVQDQNEINVAGRGIYGSSQQKMLVLLNGHRLNSRSYSSANPDYSIGLDKIECIEILRAPGSSLYGNVALTFVINIITKKGVDLNGTEVSVGMGNYGQRKLSFLFGNEFENGKSDLLLWGSYYESDGETVGVPVNEDYSRESKDSYAILDGFKDKGSYDIGLNYEFSNWKLIANQRYSKYIEPFSAGGITGETYNYTDYRTLRGIGPGLGSKFSHVGIDYDNDISNNLHLQLQFYYNENEIQVSAIENPTIKQHIFAAWYERNLGFIAQLRHEYKKIFGGQGTLLIGVQEDRMNVYDSEYIVGTGGEWSSFKDESGRKLLDTGSERISSLFTQIKHKFSDQFIGNIGLRFDTKERLQGEKIDNVSPRLALIWRPNDKLDLKFSYSRAFVDAPYWYRYNILPSYQGADSLQPEYMESYQLTPTIKLKHGKITSSLNFFYNKFSDFIWRNNNSAPNQPQYQNAGFLKVWGIENETSYKQNSYNLGFNFTYQAADGAENYGVSDDKIWNVPNFTANFILNVNPFELFHFNNETISQDLWLNLTARYIGEQLSPIDIAFPNGKISKEPNNQVDDVVLFNTGFRWNKLWKDFFLDARVYNLLDEDYYQGGSVTHPYPQAGRWFMLTVGYKGNW